ncbi:hypothetical protein CEXT_747801 [Caerostris extrusa]|uniref:Uncharacterized protein n=1 Tax=Caerostris extrusa TaxID=172846 RepID=A0AAV4T8H3_CAEEX|nr:hypothetical protein CEXT_747801 [Caerostris extrusa]
MDCSRRKQTRSSHVSFFRENKWHSIPLPERWYPCQTTTNVKRSDVRSSYYGLFVDGCKWAEVVENKQDDLTCPSSRKHATFNTILTATIIPERWYPCQTTTNVNGLTSETVITGCLLTVRIFSRKKEWAKPLSEKQAIHMSMRVGWGKKGKESGIN